VAVGGYALSSNVGGINNTAVGLEALSGNISGGSNIALGLQALRLTTAGNNTGLGTQTMSNNIGGTANTAVGNQALLGNTSGNSNIALGADAGSNLTTGNNNIDIFDPGVSNDSNTIRLGTQGTQTATYIAGITGVAVTGSTVVVSSTGQLGVAGSSERFKEKISEMGRGSEVLYGLQPVSFRYKPEIDAAGTAQFGLIAEQVDKVDPDLVVRDAKGQFFTVRYEAVNAMLLNEFLKQHRQVEDQRATIDEQETRIGGQEREVAELKATVAGQEREQKELREGVAAQQAEVRRLREMVEALARGRVRPAPAGGEE
jgi:cell division protein FtsB